MEKWFKPSRSRKGETLDSRSKKIIPTIFAISARINNYILIYSKSQLLDYVHNSF